MNAPRLSQLAHFSQRLQARAKAAPGRLWANAVDAFNRADEWGGDMRDILLAKLGDPRLQNARAQLSQFVPPSARAWVRGKTSEPPVASGVPSQAPVAAPDVVARTPRPAQGYGNPALAAQIFGRKSCPWTGRAITLLERHKVDYDYVDLDDPDHERLATPLANETKQQTVPYVYLRGHFIGGYNALAEVERLGQLPQALLAETSNAGGRRIEIAPRPNSDEPIVVEQDPALLS